MYGETVLTLERCYWQFLQFFFASSLFNLDKSYRIGVTKSWQFNISLAETAYRLTSASKSNNYYFKLFEQHYGLLFIVVRDCARIEYKLMSIMVYF
jgi:hypothetical protein